MIFGLATDDGGLMAFATDADAISYCEGIDVENGEWSFFANDGAPLEAHFTAPNRKGSFTVASGTYVLRPAASSPPLRSVLSNVRYVEGQGLHTIADVEAVLANARLASKQ
jgi:hypothetical protein